MAHTSKILRSNIGYSVSAKSLVITALVLAGLGAFSSPARAQEARPDFFFSPHKANLSRVVVVGDSLSIWTTSRAGISHADGTR